MRMHILLPVLASILILGTVSLAFAVTNPLAVTLIGGNDFDIIRAFAVDEDGNIYVVADMRSANFVTLSPTIGSGGGDDILVAKLNPDLTIANSVRIGGSDFDLPRGIEINSSGDLIIMGSTYSSNFPKGDGTTYASKGLGDIFVIKLTPDLLDITASNFFW